MLLVFGIPLTRAGAEARDEGPPDSSESGHCLPPSPPLPLTFTLLALAIKF